MNSTLTIDFHLAYVWTWTNGWCQSNVRVPSVRFMEITRPCPTSSCATLLYILWTPWAVFHPIRCHASSNSGYPRHVWERIFQQLYALGGRHPRSFFPFAVFIRSRVCYRVGHSLPVGCCHECHVRASRIYKPFPWKNKAQSLPSSWKPVNHRKAYAQSPTHPP